MPDVRWYGSSRGPATLYFPNGAVLDFNAGDVTLTHSTDALTLAGGVLLLPDGTAAAPSLARKDDAATGVYFFGTVGAGNIYFSPDGVASVQVNASNTIIRSTGGLIIGAADNDARLSRSAAGNLKVTTDGTTLGTLSANSLTTTGTAGPTQSHVASYYVGASFYQTAGLASTDLQYATGFAIYCKGSKLVIGYNNAGNQVRYKIFPLDGASTAWTDTATAP